MDFILDKESIFDDHPVLKGIDHRDVKDLHIILAQRYLPDIHSLGFAFLVIFFELLDRGVDHVSLEDRSHSPVIHGVCSSQLSACYQDVPQNIREQLFYEEEGRIYLHTIYRDQNKVFRKLHTISCAVPIHDMEIEDHDRYSPEQNQALQGVSRSCFSIIHGGPGSGKTFVITRLVQSFHQQHPMEWVIILTPTGKAASHIRYLLNQLGQNSSRILIQTLHRFLFSNQDKIDMDPALIIVDEGSMVTFSLLDQLLQHISGYVLDHGEGYLSSRLVIVGDPNQLPPIGFGVGNPLQDLCHRFSFCSYPLHGSKRTSNSQILQTAQHILEGKGIDTLPLESVSSLIEKAVVLFSQTLTHDAPSPQVCILTPLRKGKWGSESLNQHITQEMKKKFSHLPIPIMVSENVVSLDLYNGDIGMLDPMTQMIRFPRNITIKADHFPFYRASYVMSVHKSQGSEYNHVVFIVPPGGEVFDRSLLYTGVTRAKQRLDIYADQDTLQRIMMRD